MHGNQQVRLLLPDSGYFRSIEAEFWQGAKNSYLFEHFFLTFTANIQTKVFKLSLENKLQERQNHWLDFRACR